MISLGMLTRFQNTFLTYHNVQNEMSKYVSSLEPKDGGLYPGKKAIKINKGL